MTQEQLSLALDFTPSQDSLVSKPHAMPTLKPRRKAIKLKPKNRLNAVLSIVSIKEMEARNYKAAMAVLAELDRRIDRQRGESAKLRPVERNLPELRVIDPDTDDLNRAHIHKLTDGMCHRPDLYFQGGKACDYCALFPWCLAKVKRLKDPNTQPPDRNPGYFAAIEAAKAPLPRPKPQRTRFVAAGYKAKQLVKGKKPKAVKIVVAEKKVKIVASKPKAKVVAMPKPKKVKFTIKKRK